LASGFSQGLHDPPPFISLIYSPPLVITSRGIEMKQTQKDLLIELVRKERMRLTVALSEWVSRHGYSPYEEMATLNKERDLCTSTLKSLTGGE